MHSVVLKGWFPQPAGHAGGTGPLPVPCAWRAHHAQSLSPEETGLFHVCRCLQGAALWL